MRYNLTVLLYILYPKSHNPIYCNAIPDARDCLRLLGYLFGVFNSLCSMQKHLDMSSFPEESSWIRITSLYPNKIPNCLRWLRQGAVERYHLNVTARDVSTRHTAIAPEFSIDNYWSKSHVARNIVPIWAQTCVYVTPALLFASDKPRTALE